MGVETISPVLTIVNGQFSAASTYISSAFAAVTDAIATINSAAGAVPSPGSIDVNPIDNPLDEWTPSTAIPDAPTTPDAPEDAPTLSLTTPGAPTIDIDMGVTFYDSNLLSALRDKIIANITDGGTGITPAVETAIWQRDLEREEQAFQDAIDKMTRHWAKRGFRLPDGVYAANLQALQKEYMNKRIDRSREIAIKQAELEQNNLFKSFDIAVQIETQVIGFVNNVAVRTLEASKATADALISVYDTMVKEQSNQVGLFKEQVEAYVANMSAITQRYNAEVEAYKGEVGAWEASQDMTLKALLGSVDADVKIATIDIQEFGEKVRKYQADIGAKAEALKALASLAGQAAGAATIGIHASADVGARASDSYSVTYDHNYDET